MIWFHRGLVLFGLDYLYYKSYPGFSLTHPYRMQMRALFNDSPLYSLLQPTNGKAHSSRILGYLPCTGHTCTKTSIRHEDGQGSRSQGEQPRRAATESSHGCCKYRIVAKTGTTQLAANARIYQHIPVPVPAFLVVDEKEYTSLDHEPPPPHDRSAYAARVTPPARQLATVFRTPRRTRPSDTLPRKRSSTYRILLGTWGRSLKSQETSNAVYGSRDIRGHINRWAFVYVTQNTKA